MALQNLLSGGARGELGSYVTQRQKGKNIVKTKSLKKTAMRKASLDNFSAFAVLNRLSSALAKQWYYWLGLKPDNTLKHNQVAKMLKVCVATHTFNLDALETIFIPNPNVQITKFEVDYVNGKIIINANANLEGEVGIDFSWIIVVLDKYGYIHYASPQLTKQADIELFTTAMQTVGIEAITLASIKRGNMFSFCGYNKSVVEKLPIVENETLYPRHMERVTAVYIFPDTYAMAGNIFLQLNTIVYPSM